MLDTWLMTAYENNKATGLFDTPPFKETDRKIKVKRKLKKRKSIQTKKENWEKIKKILTKNKWSMAEFSREIGMYSGTVRNWKSGGFSPAKHAKETIKLRFGIELK